MYLLHWPTETYCNFEWWLPAGLCYDSAGCNMQKIMQVLKSDHLDDVEIMTMAFWAVGTRLLLDVTIHLDFKVYVNQRLLCEMKARLNIWRCTGMQPFEYFGQMLLEGRKDDPDMRQKWWHCPWSVHGGLILFVLDALSFLKCFFVGLTCKSQARLYTLGVSVATTSCVGALQASTII